MDVAAIFSIPKCQTISILYSIQLTTNMLRSDIFKSKWVHFLLVGAFLGDALVHCFCIFRKVNFLMNTYHKKFIL